MVRPTYSIIIPTKNEEEAIGRVICSIPNDIRKKSEIIVVDSSSDHTPKISNGLGAKVIKERGGGKGRAMKTGVKHSKGDVLIFLDGDGTDPPEYIPKLLSKLKKSQLVLGNRSFTTSNRDDKLLREINKIQISCSMLLFKMGGMKITGDPLAGFRAIRRKDWDKLDIQSNDFRIETEINIKSLDNNFKITEVHIPHLKRGGGILNSKTFTNPRETIKILSLYMKYLKGKENYKTI